MPKLHVIQGAGFAALLIVLILCLETKAALGAFHSAPDALTGLQLSAMSLTCALIAFFGFGLAGRLKDDERPAVRGRAKAARFVALAFLFVPITFLGSALKADRLSQEWEAYRASPAYQADVALSQDMLSDRYEREAARSRLIQPTSANLDILDGEFLLAAVLQFLLIFASDALRVPAPITPEEVKHWRSVAAGKKAAITRKRNAAKRKQRKPFLRVVGGKS